MFYYQNTIVIVNIIFPLLAIIAVTARLSARRITKLALGFDDWLILLALIVTVADAIYTIVGVYTFGYGDSVTKNRGINSASIFKFLYVDTILINFVIGVIKCSVVLFYKRVFSTQRFAKVANVVLLFSIAWTIAATLTSIFHTNPIPAYWEEHGFTSLNFGALQIALNVTDLVLDLVILSLPLPVIRSLHISPKKRFALLGIFGLGAFCVVATCVRLDYFIRLPTVVNNHTYLVQNAEEATVETDASILWVHIECSASIITACLPTLVPVMTMMKTVTISLAGSLTRLTRSKTSVASHSDTSLDLDTLKQSKSNEKGSSQEFEAYKPNGQIQATTVISVI